MALAALPTTRNEVSFEVRGAGSALFAHRDKEVLLSGPAGTGKTVATLLKVHLMALKYPGMRALMARKEGTALAGSAVKTYEQYIKGSGNFQIKFFGGSKIKPPQYEYPNGSVIVLGSFDNPEKIMSAEYDVIYVNEATELELTDWELSTSRLRNGVVPYQQLIADCNPSYPSHWLKRRCDAGLTRELPSKHEDNPKYFDGTNWTKDGIEYLDTLNRLTGHRYQRLRLGKWVAAEGLVYPGFTPEQIQEVDCSGWATVLGLDLGTRNPTSIHTYRHAGDRIHVESEFYQRGLGSDDIADEAERRYRDSNADWIVIDPSAAGLIITLQQRGLTVKKGVNDIVVGISRVTSVLPSITVDPSCSNMIAEFESYAYSTTQKTERDVPVKAQDHCLVAGTLVQTEIGSMPIEYVVAGDMVWTRHGLRRVLAAGMTNPSVQVYTVTLSDGRTITGSSLHPFWANDQWKTLDSLRYGDILRVWTDELTPSSTTASPSTAIQTRRTGLNAPIMSRTLGIVGAELVASTRRFGRRITAQFQRVITFTTTTKTRSITNPAISFASQHTSIDPFTVASPQVNESALTSTAFDLSLLSGTDRRKEKRGIANTRNNAGLIEPLRRVSALNAAPSSQPLPNGKQIDSVQPNAELHFVAPVALTTKTERAGAAAPSSVSIDTCVPATAPVSVVSVVAEPQKQAVYNLTVQDIPEFFANGILVHNSMDELRYVVMELETPPEPSWSDVAADHIARFLGGR
jgi:PBSX family phage terminase large subunit